MFTHQELDELFCVTSFQYKLFQKDLNLVAVDNETWRSHQDVFTSREQVSCIFFVCGGIDITVTVKTDTSEVTCDAFNWFSQVK